MSERAEQIVGTVQDLVEQFINDDRKECEDLPRGEIEAAIDAGEISVNGIVAVFRGELVEKLR